MIARHDLHVVGQRPDHIDELVRQLGYLGGGQKLVPWGTLEPRVNRHEAYRGVRSLSTKAQFVALLHDQLSGTARAHPGADATVMTRVTFCVRQVQHDIITITCANAELRNWAVA